MLTTWYCKKIQQNCLATALKHTIRRKILLEARSLKHTIRRKKYELEARSYIISE